MADARQCRAGRGEDGRRRRRQSAGRPGPSLPTGSTVPRPSVPPGCLMAAAPWEVPHAAALPVPEPRCRAAAASLRLR